MKFTCVLPLLLGLSANAFAGQMDQGKKQLHNAQTIQNVDLVSYNCSTAAMDALKGKCALKFKQNENGKELDLTASPEVGAPWGNGYGSSDSRPMSRLTIVVTAKGEVLTVKDESGNRISTKFDFTR